MSTSPANSAHQFVFSNESPECGLVPAGVVPSRVPIDPNRRMPTPTSRRLRYGLPGVKTFLVTSLIVANFAAYFVIESSPPATDLARLAELALREARPVTPPSLPQ